MDHTDHKDQYPAHAIAIVGLAGRFPGASDLDAFWRNIREGVESLEDFSDEDLREAGVDPALSAQPQYVKRGTVLQESEHFDAAFFGLSPREAQVIDPQQRIFLECAWEALEHAGYAPGAIEAPVGVYAGASMNSYLLAQILRNPALAAAVGGYQLMLGNDKDFLCTRVSYKLDLRGPSMTLQTACSTSLVAVQAACRALERHECDMALAGGVSLSFPQRGGYLYQEGMILSPDGHCRPFDADAKGTRPGAGAGIVVLKRLSDALADGDTIHAVIRGAAINNDGAGKAGYTAPSVDGQVEAIATAQILAGVEPRSIGYIEAHGTATPLGDPIEIMALRQVFEGGTDERGFCRLGSLKANLGHLDAAAGVAGLIKAVLVLKHRELPPLVNFQRPNPQLNLADSPFTASAQAAPWPAGATPRRAGVSSFGIGGTNAHVVLEEAPEPAREPVEAGPQLIVLSARSEAALDAATDRLKQHLRNHPEASLRDVAWTLQTGRRAFAQRRVVAASSAAELIAALDAPQRAPVFSARHEGGERPVAFLFSGQGSQFAGMGAGLYAQHAVYRDAVDRCAGLLREPLGRDLRELLFAPAGDKTINETRYAQPALFVTEYALALLWQSWGVRPAAMLGHSIGEYVAAHLAGVLSLDDALTLVAARGRLMQGMAPGGMAAVHMAEGPLRAWLTANAPALEIAAVNAPGLCAIAGPREALDAGLAVLRKAPKRRRCTPRTPSILR
jgi:phthiocerol/phenolphthiocerol synthesis type-I polyketide synthase E